MREPIDLPEGLTLDPGDWRTFRVQAHRMLADMLDYVEHIRERPVWQPIPEGVRARFRETVPTEPTELASVHGEFMRSIMPFATGNVHPAFMGWMHGGGNVVGMLAEMLAAGLNANLGGRDHVPIEVERQITRWMRELFGFPDTATGLFVTGSSMANLIGVLVARTARLGAGVRQTGLAGATERLTAYASSAAHGCIARAMDFSGLGTDALRIIPVNERHQLDLDAFARAIAADRAAGFSPFVVIGTAGTVDTGAIDDLAGMATLARKEELWFHVDGAFGSLAILAPDIAPLLAGMERADSIALDFHKWGQVPYDSGFILVRDGGLHQRAFASPAAYLRREARGLAAGSPWPSDFGPDLSRGFRALKTWFTLKVYGTEALGAVISRTCALARYLRDRVVASPELELLAPVELNIVCFRYRHEDADDLNARILIDLQESGVAAPSSTIVGNRLAIRAAIVNHRTQPRDVDALVEAVLELGRRLGSPHLKEAVR
jgi:glutamate/tyrosine decarboxylase-like PLP-dependent enzyme